MAQDNKKISMSFRNLLALGVLNALLMVVGGVDIYQGGWAFPGFIGGETTPVYQSFGIIYAILGVIYALIVYYLFRQQPWAVSGILVFSILALILSILWLPGSLLAVIVSIGAIYYAAKKDLRDYITRKRI